MINPVGEPFEWTQSGTILKELENSPEFLNVAEDILMELGRYEIVVSANDGYDVSTLSAALNLNDIDSKPFEYVNAKSLCRRCLNSLSYSLQSLAFDFNIAEPGLYPVDIAVNSDDFDELNPLFDKNVCFTGAMNIERKTARQFVELIGGHYQDNITATANFLVEGVQQSSVVGPDGISGKKRKAMELRAKGKDIEYLTEADFMDIISTYRHYDKFNEMLRELNRPKITIEFIGIKK